MPKYCITLTMYNPDFPSTNFFLSYSQYFEGLFSHIEFMCKRRAVIKSLMCNTISYEHLMCGAKLREQQDTRRRNFISDDEKKFGKLRVQYSYVSTRAFICKATERRIIVKFCMAVTSCHLTCHQRETRQWPCHNSGAQPRCHSVVRQHVAAIPMP